MRTLVGVFSALMGIYAAIAVLLWIPGAIAGYVQTLYYSGSFAAFVLPAELVAALWLAVPFGLLIVASGLIWLSGRLVARWCHCPSQSF